MLHSCVNATCDHIVIAAFAVRYRPYFCESLSRFCLLGLVSLFVLPSLELVRGPV